MLTTLRSTTYKRGAKGEARTLSPRTIRYYYVTLRKALDTALRNGAVPRNVARLIEAPTVPKVEVVAHNPEDIGRIADLFDASTDRLAPLYILAVYTGCGSGELLRLKWDDINFEAGTQRDRQAFERQKLGDSYTDHGLVCAMALGTPLARDNMTKRLGRVQKAASISSARPFHTLRHDNATLTLLAGVTPKTTADRLGHHSPAVTLERYTHAVRALDDDAADRLQASLTQVRRKAAGAS